MKCDLWRITEEQATSSLHNNIPDSSSRETDFLENLVDETKPLKTLEQQYIQAGYHYLVYSQFRYPLPVPSRYAARFKPPLHMENVFYGGLAPETSYHEYVYHFLRQRLHISGLSEFKETRTIFSVEFHDDHTTDLRHLENTAAIMHKTDYSLSHSFVKSNQCSSILYPSARHHGGECVAVFDIRYLKKIPKSHENIQLSLNAINHACHVKNPFRAFTIKWSDVS
ncbi:MAG: RES family NAD+ phosphorylase [Oligoflexus sp.]|nr:RES family NAD+ phosphorylase [Oligoflexus sp.]